ncbi:hypothetical protein Q9F25_003433 [Vibrio cholerae]
MTLGKVILKISMTKALSGVLAVSTLLGGYVAVKDIFFTESEEQHKAQSSVEKADGPMEYSESIPLVYSDINKFKEFLHQNVGKTVKFNTQIAFDIVLPENILAHSRCNFGDFIEAVRKNPENVSNVELDLPEFSSAISEANLDYYYDNETQTQVFLEDTSRLVSCMDKLRILVKDPRSLRFSYGGTGTMSLPLWGTFVIELRAYSGPTAEYTLREL